MVVINALGIIAYLLVTLWIIHHYRQHLVFFGYVSFMSFWALVSCFYNDLGVYNIELFRYTESTYATARLAAYSIVFNLGFFGAARLIGHRPLARVDYSFSRGSLQAGYFKFIVYTAITVVMIYFVYSFATEGIPVLSGLSRIDFFRRANFLERNLIIYAPLAAFLLGYYRRKRARISYHGIILIVFLAFAIAIGNKFSLLITILVSYFASIYAGYIVANPDFRIFSRRRLAGLAIVMLILLLMTFGSYLYAFDSLSYAYTILVNRVLAFQGQMWWAVDHDISTSGRYDRNHWVVELDNIVSPGDTGEGDVGMKYLMVKTLGPETAYSIFDRGYLYTQTYPAILIATFPHAVAIVFQFLAGIGFFLISYYFYYSIIYRHSLRAVLTLLILMPYVAMLLSGNFGTFFTAPMLLKIAALLVMELGAYRLPAMMDGGPARPARWVRR